jgi:phytoene dehydrogenase-like protein
MRAAADVTVVGAGPNGLAAAIVFAAAGLTVSVCEAQPRPRGGARTEKLDLGVPLLHDLCSAVHPMAMASPFFQHFELRLRVEFGVPEVSYAHPSTTVRPPWRTATSTGPSPNCPRPDPPDEPVGAG